MKKAPIDKLIPTETMLATMGSSVKGLPGIIPWGEDLDKKLYVYPDGDALWAACPETGFCGDAIDICKQIFEEEDTDAIVWKLIKLGLLPDEVEDESIAKYTKAKNLCLTANSFWAAAKARGLSMAGRMSIPLKWHISPTNVRTWADGFASYVGFCDNHLFQQYFNCVAPLKLKNSVVVAYYDLPGRISFFRFYVNSPGGIKFFDKEITNLYGVAMAGGLPFSPSTALALTDPVEVLKLNYKHYCDTGIRGPFICYHPGTPYFPMEQSKLIFVSDNPDLALFKDSRHVQGCSIAVLTARDTALIRHPEGMVSYVKQTAKPWELAFKNYILGLPTVSAEIAIDTMDLDESEISRILYTCLPDEREIFSQLVHESETTVSCFIDNTEILVKKNGWYVKTDKGSEIISNFSFEIYKVIEYATEQFMVGDLNFKGKVTSFVAPMAAMTQNAGQWLYKFIADKKLGWPFCEPKWGSRLLRVSGALFGDDLEYEDRVIKLGWADDNYFCYPNVSISRGLVKTGDVAGVPVKCGILDTVDDLFPEDELVRISANTVINQNVWVMVYSQLYNIIAEFYGIGRKNIGFTGSYRMYKLMSDVFDFKPKHFQEKSHQMSMAVPVNRSLMVQDTNIIQTAMERKVSVFLDPKVLAPVQAAYHKDWIFIELQNTAQMINTNFSYGALVLNFVKEFQNTKQFATASPTSETFDEFVWTMVEQFFKSTGVNSAMLDKIKQLVMIIPSRTQALATGIVEELKRGGLTVNNHITYDDTIVRIDKLPLLEGSPIWFDVLSTGVDNITIDNDFIYFKRSYWDSLTRLLCC